jgi:regulatory protein
MRVKSITKVKSKKNIFNVSFVGAEDARLCADTIARFLIKNDLEISDNEYKEIISYDRAALISAEAFNLIAKRSLSAKSLSDKLALKNYDKNEIENIVEKMKNLGYINDEKFALDYAEYLNKKAKGSVFIEAELKKHQIDKEIISKILQELKNNIPPYRQIAEILKTKYKNADFRDKKNLVKAALFFERRGFEKDDIDKAFRSINAELI